MKNANEREQAPCRHEIGFNLPGEAVYQQVRAFVVHGAPPVVDRFDLGSRQPLDRVKIRLAYPKIVLDQLAEWRQGQVKRRDRAAIFGLDVEDQPSVLYGNVQVIRADGRRLPLSRNQLETIFLDEIENRDLAFLRDFGRRRGQAGIVQGQAADSGQVSHFFRIECDPDVFERLVRAREAIRDLRASLPWGRFFRVRRASCA